MLRFWLFVAPSWDFCCLLLFDIGAQQTGDTYGQLMVLASFRDALLRGSNEVKLGQSVCQWRYYLKNARNAMIYGLLLNSMTVNLVYTMRNY